MSFLKEDCMSSSGGTGNTEFPKTLGKQRKNQWWIIIGMNGQWRKCTVSLEWIKSHTWNESAICIYKWVIAYKRSISFQAVEDDRERTCGQLEFDEKPLKNKQPLSFSCY